MSKKIYPDDYAAMLVKHAGEKWRPSNGTDGDVFMSMNCHQCEFGKFIREGMHFDDAEEHERCAIVGVTFILDVEDEGYPVEWQYGTDGQPTCTAFHQEGEPHLPERCAHTVDMFAPVIIGCDPAHHADMTAIFVPLCSCSPRVINMDAARVYATNMNGVCVECGKAVPKL